MNKVAIIADPLSAQVFMATSFMVRPVQESDSTATTLREIVQTGYKIIFITENLAEDIEQQINEIQKKNNAMITIIPGMGTSLQLGERMLKELRRKVVGVRASE
jgi:V/A-type H+-transporting ATPase subunit F